MPLGVVSVVRASGVDDIAAVSPVWKMLLSLVIVVALIPVFLFGVKKLQSVQLKLGKASAIQVMTVQSLGTKEKLVIVEVDEQRLLLGVTANSIALLKDLTTKDSFSKLIDEENSRQNDLHETIT